MKIFGIKNCDKIKKTIKWCQQQNKNHDFHDYRVDGIDATLLESFLQHHPITELVNKRSTTWRQLTDEQKATLDPSIIIDNPTLLKRPLVEINEQLYIGYFPEQWQ